MASRRLIVEIVGDAKSLEAALGRASASAGSFEKRMGRIGATTSRVGGTLSRDLTLPIVGASVASVKLAQNFDLLISRMVGLGGVTQKQSAQFKQFILNLSPKVGKGPEELANALYQIVSAGVKGQRALQALTVSAKASAAGLGDTATVADAISSAMNAYAKSGLTAKHAADVLSAAVRDGKGEASAFAPVLGKVVAVASQLGVPFDQAAAALAQMTKLGVPADAAATQLSATFSGLLKTTPKAEKALEAMGLSAAGLRQELREKGLLATLQTLNEKTHGSTVAMAEAFPNVRALRGVLQLVGQSAQGTAQVFADTKNSTQSLSTAFNAAAKTDAFKMQQSLANLKVAGIQLGETLMPLAVTLAGDVTRLAHAFESLSPGQKHMIEDAALAAAALGPLLKVVGNVEKAVGLMGGALKLFGKLAGPLAAETATIDTEIAGVGAAADASTAQVSALRAALLRLGKGVALGGLGVVAGAEAYGIYKGVTTTNTQPSGQYRIGPGGQPQALTPTRAGGPTWRNVSAAEYQRATGINPSAVSSTPGDKRGAAANRGQGGSLYGVSLAGESPMIPAALKALAQSGYQVDVTSGRRSSAEQAALYARYVKSGFNIKYIAAKPGTSNHETGNAVDVYVNGKPVDQSPGALALLRKFGLVSDVAGDHEHLDLRSGGGGGGGGGSTYDPLAGTAGSSASAASSATGSSAASSAAAAKRKLAEELAKAKAKLVAKLAAAASKAATASIAKIEKAATGPEQTLALAQAAGAPADEILADQKHLLSSYDSEAAKLRAKLKTSTGQARQKFGSALSSLTGKIGSTTDGIASSLQAIISGAQQQLSGVLGDLRDAADRQLGNGFFQNGQLTPSEALLQQMQAADAATQLQKQLDDANKQLASDQETRGISQGQIDAARNAYNAAVAAKSAAQGGTDAASYEQLGKAVTDAKSALDNLVNSGVTDDQLQQDKDAVSSAQRAIDESNLAIKAAQERAQADKEYAAAQFNLNTKIAGWSTELQSGKINLTTFLADLKSVGVDVSNLFDPGGNDILGPLTTASSRLQTAFDNLADWIDGKTGKSSRGASGPSAPSAPAGAGVAGTRPLPGQAIPMAAGGFGRAVGPTLFYSKGGEDFAFSGEGRSFGRGNGTYVFNFPNYIGTRDDLQSLLKSSLKQMNNSGAFVKADLPR